MVDVKTAPVSGIRAELAAAGDNSELLDAFILSHAADEREGVRKMTAAAVKKLARLEAEADRVRKMHTFEQDILSDYLTGGYVCGVDEAGRGPLAGPVAAGAVIMPPDREIPGINDSKKLSPKARDELYNRIVSEAVSWAVVMVGPETVDEKNILQATYEAMREAVLSLDPAPEAVAADAVRIPGLHLPQMPVVKGDAKCYSIAAASILAKVTRDRYMEEMDALYPAYGFAGNKGYGSADHIEALKKYGPCPIHRSSFIGHFIDPGTVSAVRSTHDIGAEYEEKASEYLKEKGFSILRRNYRTPLGEIDIIAGDPEGCLVFVEVKHRRSMRFGCAAEAVNRAKKEALTRTALCYLKENGIDPGAKMRFDVIASDRGKISHIVNAF